MVLRSFTLDQLLNHLFQKSKFGLFLICYNSVSFLQLRNENSKWITLSYCNIRFTNKQANSIIGMSMTNSFKDMIMSSFVVKKISCVCGCLYKYWWIIKIFLCNEKNLSDPLEIKIIAWLIWSFTIPKKGRKSVQSNNLSKELCIYLVFSKHCFGNP